MIAVLWLIAGIVWVITPVGIAYLFLQGGRQRQVIVAAILIEVILTALIAFVGTD